MLKTLIANLTLLTLSTAAFATTPLVVHEWGTFTALQDEQGKALGRINTDDEPVPPFVHELKPGTLFPPTAAYLLDLKGIPAGDPQVTMRLETPVLYFHPGTDTAGTPAAPQTVNVEVAFHGGWLTQYFPNAQSHVEGAPSAPAGTSPRFPDLDEKSVSRLTWNSVVIGATDGKSPVTQDRVWTAPRAVDSAALSVGGEREQFLFYRGVGHLDAPIQILRTADTLELRNTQTGMSGDSAWLVDIHADHTMAFRKLTRGPATQVIRTNADFAPGEYTRENLSRLKSQMREGLIAEGLFADEANAMLNTWQVSYFESIGERVFFMVPQEWTDHVLPLKLSLPAQITRVMVGRIELVTPAATILLHRLAQTVPADAAKAKLTAAAISKLRLDPAMHDAYNALAGGQPIPQTLGLEIPPCYADYLALGRFRTALLYHSQDHPEALAKLAEMFTQ